MKAFIFSLTVLIIMTILIIFNCVTIVNITDKLDNGTRELDFDSEQHFVELFEYWESKRFLITLSVPHEKVDSLEQCLSVLKDKYKTKDFTSFYEYKSLLIDNIEEIKKTQDVSFDSIF